MSGDSLEIISSPGNLKARGYTYNWNFGGMGGLHVDLEFPQGTDKSVHAFLKNAYFK